VLDVIAKLGVSGGIGALIGIVAVWWVEPTTTGGILLLMVISIIAAMVVGSIVSGRKHGPTQVDKDEARPQRKLAKPR
jgi:hypothetical protein